MITTNSIYENMFNERAREFVGRVELLEGSTLIDIFEHDGALINFSVEKIGDNTKFFGYGVCQRATVKLRDKDRAIVATKEQGLQIAHGIGNDYLYTYPLFKIDEILRDENTNELTLTGYDLIYSAANYKVDQLQLPEEFTLKTFAIACASLLGAPAAFINIPATLMNVTYTKSLMNFSGSETIREALDDVAEMFGAIYYLSNDWEITFQCLDKTGEPVATIDKTKYFELKAKTAHTLTTVMSVTELGDNVSSSTGNPGETQYLRENAFLTLRNDIGTLLDVILSAVSGLTIVQFECKHRGDFRLEIGDKIAFTTKDNDTIVTYMLDDSITYNGGLVGSTKWEYSTNEAVTDSNPSTLGEALKMTYAKVDKVNQEITLLAQKIDNSDMSQIEQEMASLKITTDQISAEVSYLEQRADTTEENMTTLTESVNATISSDNLAIIIQETMADGLNSVKTETGFTFDADGLTVSKDGAATHTQITENGMTVYNNNDEAVLTANAKGVEAKDLHARTYLLIGETSRFEDYTSNTGNIRTGCFWIG